MIPVRPVPARRREALPHQGRGLFRPRAPWRVADVEALPGLRLRVRFNDGTEGTVEMAEFLNSEAAGAFAALRDEKFFGR